MPSTKPRFTYRTEQEVLDKLKYIADKEKRTINQQIDKIICDYVELYENKHGKIEIPTESA